MNSDFEFVKQHVERAISNAVVEEMPYPHFYITNVFPESYYNKILEYWPMRENMQPLVDSGRITFFPKGLEGPELLKAIQNHSDNKRFIIDLNKHQSTWPDSSYGNFWSEFSQWICGDSFLEKMANTFMHYIVRQRKIKGAFPVEAEALLVEDDTRYGIDPHTDSKRRYLSSIFYCPRDSSIEDLGTSIYSRNSTIVPELISSKRYGRSLFNQVKKVPFKRNSLFGFIVSNNSFHGVEEITQMSIPRRSIQHMVVHPN